MSKGKEGYETKGINKQVGSTGDVVTNPTVDKKKLCAKYGALSREKLVQMAKIGQ